MSWLLEKFFEQRYDMEHYGDVQEITQVSTGMLRVSRRLDSYAVQWTRVMADRVVPVLIWALSQYVTGRRIWLIAIGFILTLVGLL